MADWPLAWIILGGLAIVVILAVTVVCDVMAVWRLSQRKDHVDVPEL